MAFIHPGSLSNVHAFSGRSDEDAYEWLSHVNKAGDLFGWSYEQRAAVAALKLRGLAGQWARGLPDDIQWPELSAALIERFGDSFESLLTQLYRCVQGPTEAAKAFNDRFCTIKHRLEMLQPVMPNQPESLMFKAQYMQSLKPELRCQVATQKPTNLEAAMRAANYFDELHLARGASPPMACTSHAQSPWALPHHRSTKDSNDRSAYIPRPSPVENQVSTPPRWPPTRSEAAVANPAATIEQLQQDMENMRLMYETSGHDSPAWQRVCHNCGGAGHIRRNCPMRPQVHFNMVEFMAPSLVHAGTMMPRTSANMGYGVSGNVVYSDTDDMTDLVSDDESDMESNYSLDMSHMFQASPDYGMERTSGTPAAAWSRESIAEPMTCMTGWCDMGTFRAQACLTTRSTLTDTSCTKGRPPTHAEPAGGTRQHIMDRFASQPSRNQCRSNQRPVIDHAAGHPAPRGVSKAPCHAPMPNYLPCVHAAATIPVPIQHVSAMPDCLTSTPQELPALNGSHAAIKQHVNLLERHVASDHARLNVERYAPSWLQQTSVFKSEPQPCKNGEFAEQHVVTILDIQPLPPEPQDSEEVQLTDKVSADMHHFSPVNPLGAASSGLPSDLTENACDMQHTTGQFCLPRTALGAKLPDTDLCSNNDNCGSDISSEERSVCQHSGYMIRDGGTPDSEEATLISEMDGGECPGHKSPIDLVNCLYSHQEPCMMAMADGDCAVMSGNDLQDPVVPVACVREYGSKDEPPVASCAGKLHVKQAQAESAQLAHDAAPPPNLTIRSNQITPSASATCESHAAFERVLAAGLFQASSSPRPPGSMSKASKAVGDPSAQAAKLLSLAVPHQPQKRQYEGVIRLSGDTMHKHDTIAEAETQEPQPWEPPDPGTPVRVHHKKAG